MRSHQRRRRFVFVTSAISCLCEERSHQLNRLHAWLLYWDLLLVIVSLREGGGLLRHNGVELLPVQKFLVSLMRSGSWPELWPDVGWREWLSVLFWKAVPVVMATARGDKINFYTWFSDMQNNRRSYWKLVTSKRNSRCSRKTERSALYERTIAMRLLRKRNVLLLVTFLKSTSFVPG